MFRSVSIQRARAKVILGIVGTTIIALALCWFILRLNAVADTNLPIYERMENAWQTFISEPVE